MPRKWKIIGAALIAALGIGGGVAIAQGGDTTAGDETVQDDNSSADGVDDNSSAFGVDDNSSADGGDDDSSSAATP